MLNQSQPRACRLAELARLADATLVGDPDFQVRGVVHPARATRGDQLALAIESGALEALRQSVSQAAVVVRGAEVEIDRLAGCLIVARPRYALARLLEIFAPLPRADGRIHPTAVIEPTAELGENVSVGPMTYIGDAVRIGAGTIIRGQATVEAGAQIGAGCLIHAGVRIGERVAVGDRVILQANVCLGADGFSFATGEPGNADDARFKDEVAGGEARIVRINSAGTVIVGDDVEIGAGSTIDRGTLGATVIGRGTKIDSQVLIAHNCTIGEDCLIVGQVGIAGSVSVGDRVVLAGKVGVADHLTIGHDAVIGGGSGVATDVPPRAVYIGYPARPRREKMDDLLMMGRLKRLLRVWQMGNNPPARLQQDGGNDRE